jgi:hypothetical protein
MIGIGGGRQPLSHTHTHTHTHTHNHFLLPPYALKKQTQKNKNKNNTHTHTHTHVHQPRHAPIAALTVACAALSFGPPTSKMADCSAFTFPSSRPISFSPARREAAACVCVCVCVIGFLVFCLGGGFFCVFGCFFGWKRSGGQCV